ncbi:MAG: CBS domain-containing protein [Bacteriovoracaceae bacterium]|nr:CBS domain-containing protein [Bacteriovoracaceae bacterium]
MNEFNHVNALSNFLTSPGDLAMAHDYGEEIVKIKLNVKFKESFMKARECMHKGLRTIDGNESLESAAHMMKDSDIGVLPVVSEGKVVGVLTDRDIVTRCLAEDKDYHSVKASDCMTKRVVSASEDSELEEISRHMVDQKVSRVFIEDNQHKPIGLISVEDLVHHSDPNLFKKTISAIKS